MGNNGNGSDWTVERIDLLARLWPLFPVAEIGRQMGISKNAVVGKAHRLYNSGDQRLYPKPSPIQRRPGWVKPDRPAPPPRVVPRLPPLPSLEVQQAAPAPVIIAPPPAAVPPPSPPVPVIPPMPAKPIIVRPEKPRKIQPCLFPTGESPRIRFDCTNPAAVGTPYCAEHAGRCFVRKRDHDGEEGEGSRGCAAA